MSAPTSHGLHRRALAVGDIGPLNHLFSEAFSERYRRDGLSGVRVPPLNPAIWRYAIEDAGDGAMCWVDLDDRLVAFNVAHQSGAEGWMGPLAVRPEWQGTGLGKEIVTAGIALLRARGCSVIGLETMPRTMDNIGFYSRLGFIPGRMTVSLAFDAKPAAFTRLGTLGAADGDAAIAQCAAMVDALQPGVDFTREIRLTRALGIGDTVLLRGRHGLDGFALCHEAALVEGRPREETRVLKLAVRETAALPELLRAVGGFARENGCARAAVRVQGDYPAAYQALIAMGARVRWTDLRMTLAGHAEVIPASGVIFSNWEI
ncbi:MAG: GNAT family N-acetyltransferase [Gemmatimonadetes bacterium]|nr:GNAT family N-acetyltransferase [Gemmatimonadota bacterium]